MTAEQWKAASGPFYLRQIVLSEKAEDSGLTAEEREEYERVKAEANRLFREYLHASGDRRMGRGTA